MKSSKLSNYIIAIITSVIYASVTYSSLIPHLYISSFLNHPVLAFIISMIAPLFISSIIAALITFINKKEFSIIFVWATVILSFMSSMGQSYLVKSWLETENLENTIKNLDDKILDYEKNILEEKSLRLIFDDLIDEHQNLLNDHDIQNEDLQKKDSVINQLNPEQENSE